MTDSVHYCTVSVSGRQYNSNRRRRRRRRRTPARRRRPCRRHRRCRRRRHRVDKEVGDAEQMRETS
jgi:hypothetical protein